MQAPPASEVSTQRATELAAKLRLNLQKVGGIEWWQFALQSERDQLELVFSVDRALAVPAGVDLTEIAARVALAKLKKWPDWYERLKQTEDRAIRHWRNM